MTEVWCEGCHAQLDSCGHHRASCPRSGRVKKRDTPTEYMVTRIFLEAGATVRKNVFLEDINVEVGAEDARQIEVLAQDLPCFGWAQFAVDVTLRCVLSCEGEAHPHAADTDGAVLLKARVDTRWLSRRWQRQAAANWSSWPSKQAGAGAMKPRR